MESSNKQGEGKGMPGGGVVAIGISGVSLIVNGILFMRRAGVPAKPFDIDQGHVGARDTCAPRGLVAIVNARRQSSAP
jgi:hypothetical protein